MKKLLKNNWMISIAVNLIIMTGVMLFTQMSYETNDDYAIASRIVDGYPYVGFMNYFLCRALIALQGVCGELNAYVLLLVAASFAALVCLLHTLLEAGDDVMVRLVSTAVIAVFAFDHYCTIQFTKTAALLMTAGMLVLIDCLTRKKGAGTYILSMVLLYLGACVRVDALPGALGFACMYGLAWLIGSRRQLIPEGYFTVRRVALYALTIVLVAGGFGIDRVSSGINVSTDELRLAEDYSTLRSNIVDFPTYEYYEQNRAAYDEIGISENDLYLIDHWVFDYEGAASYENLQKIDSIERPQDSASGKAVSALKKCVRDSIKAVRKRSFTGVHIMLALLIAAWMVLCLRPRHWLYIIGTGIIAGGLYAALYYLQRPTYRGMYIADIGAAVWLLYYLAVICTDRPEDVRPRIRMFAGTAVLIAAVLMLMPVSSGCADRYDSARGKVMPAEMADYFSRHDDKVFIWSTGEKKQSRDFITPWTAPGRTERNVFGTGGWGAMSPYMFNKYSGYGMYDPVKDLIDRDSAYLIANKHIKRFEEYYNKWYGGDGNTIYMELADTVCGRDIWRVKH